MSRKLNYFGSYLRGINPDGLILMYNSTNAVSYPGTGNDLFDLQGNYDAVLTNVGFNTTTKFLEYPLSGYALVDGSFSVSNSNAFTVSAVINNTQTSLFPAPFTLKTNTSDGFTVFISSVGGYLGVNFGSRTSWVRIRNNIAFDNTKNNLIVIDYNGLGSTNMNNFNLYINNSLQTNFSSGQFAVIGNNTVLGGYFPINNNARFVGDYPFFAVNNKVLPTSERNDNYTYLQQEFNL